MDGKKEKEKNRVKQFSMPISFIQLKGQRAVWWGEGRGEEQRICVLIANQGNGCTRRGQILQQAESEQVRVSPSHGHQRAKLKLS